MLKTSGTPHYENVPFEVPSSWVWCKLIDCCHIVGRIGFRGYTKEDLVNDGEGAITLSPSNIVNGLMNYDKCTFISWEKYEESPEIQVQSKDILLVKTGSSFGKCALIKHLPQKATINPQFVVLKHILINEEYLTWILQSNYARINYDSFVLGTAIPTFTQVVLGNMEIPLPPIEEQERIVAESKRWFALIELIEQGKADLQATIKQAKSKILDLAIHGKLVPQDSNDEPASELLKRINPKAEITCDNGQYGKIPKNWCWCKLEELCKIKGGKRIPRGMSFSDKKTPYIYLRVTDMKSNTILLDDLKYVDKEVFEQIKNYTINSTDLYLTIAGTIGSVGIIPEVVDGMNLTENAAKLTNIVCNKEYLLYALQSYIAQDHFTSRFHQVAQPKLSIETANKTPVPLPPLAEQQRIVDAIDKAFAKLDAIMDNL